MSETREQQLARLIENDEIVKRLKKRIEELDEYVQDQYDNHNNIAQIEKEQLLILQKILEGKKIEV